MGGYYSFARSAGRRRPTPPKTPPQATATRVDKVAFRTPLQAFVCTPVGSVHPLRLPLTACVLLCPAVAAAGLSCIHT